MSTVPQIDFSKYEIQSPPQIDFTKYAEPQQDFLTRHGPSFEEWSSLSENKGQARADYENRSTWRKMQDAIMYNTVDKAEKGTRDIAAGNYARGTHELIQGAAPVATLAAGPTAILHPLRTALAVGGGAATGAVVKGVSAAAGATPDQQQLAEDLGNIAGGAAAYKSPEIVKGVVPPLIRGAAKLSETVSPDVVGVFSPRAAHVMHVAIKLAELQKALPKDTPIPDEVVDALQNEPTPAPYRQRPGEITNAVTVTPRQVLGPSRQLRAAPEPSAPALQAAPAPYRLSGGQIINAITATPRQILPPSRQLMAPGAAGQVTIPQEAAPMLQQENAALSREIVPSERALSGESALRQILTGQDNANLMRIAKSRGINVTKESQLKPGVADKLLVNKIIDDFSPEELDGLAAKFLESHRFAHNFGDVGPEAWKTMSMQTYFPDVKLPAAMTNRVSAAISAAAPQEAEPQYAYRVRDAGETGIMPKGHAQATLDQAQAESYVPGRGSAQNAPQELVRVDLSNLDPKDYTLMKGPGNKQWVKFKRAVPESFIEKVPQVGEKAMAQAASAQAPIPQELAPQVPTSQSHLVDLLQKSIQMQRMLKRSGFGVGPNGEIIKVKP